MKRLIALDTIRPNPTAGQTEFTVTSCSLITIWGGERVKQLLDAEGDNAVLVRTRKERFGTEYEWLLHEMTTDLQTRLQGSGARGRIEVENQTFRSLHPDPSHLFEYGPLMVECRECHQRFDIEALDSDSFDDDTWSNTICPRCGAWDCLTEPVEEETIEEALRRRGETR